MNEQQWYYSFDDFREGPVAESALRQLLKSRQLNPNALLWNESLPDWKSAQSMESFAAECGSVVKAGVAPADSASRIVIEVDNAPTASPVPQRASELIVTLPSTAASPAAPVKPAKPPEVNPHPVSVVTRLPITPPPAKPAVAPAPAAPPPKPPPVAQPIKAVTPAKPSTPAQPTKAAPPKPPAVTQPTKPAPPPKPQQTIPPAKPPQPKAPPVNQPTVAPQPPKPAPASSPVTANQTHTPPASTPAGPAQTYQTSYSTTSSTNGTHKGGVGFFGKFVITLATAAACAYGFVQWRHTNPEQFARSDSPPPSRSGTLFVPGSYRTISDAIRQAGPGQIIRVKAGSYFESLDLGEGTQLEADGRVTVRSPGSQPALQASGIDAASVRGFIFTSAGSTIAKFERCKAGVKVADCTFHSGADVSVSILNSDIKLSDCSVIGGSGEGIRINGGEPVLDGNTIAQNGGPGLNVFDSSSVPSIKNNYIVGNDSGILLIGLVKPDISENNLSGNKHWGIRKSGDNRVRIVKNVFDTNGGYAIQADSSHVDFSEIKNRNTFRNNLREVYPADEIAVATPVAPPITPIPRAIFPPPQPSTPDANSPTPSTPFPVPAVPVPVPIAPAPGIVTSVRTTASEPNALVDASDGRTNLRMSPSASGTLIESIPNRETLTVLKELSSGWLQVKRSSGQTGYVKDSTVKAVDATAHAEIKLFVRQHHAKPEKNDISGLIEDYAPTVDFLSQGKSTSRSAIEADERKDFAKYDSIKEFVESEPSVSQAYYGVYTVTYRLRSERVKGGVSEPTILLDMTLQVRMTTSAPRIISQKQVRK